MDNQKIIIVGADFSWEEEKLMAACDSSDFVLLGELEVEIGDKVLFIRRGTDFFEGLQGDERFIIRRSRGAFEKLLALVAALEKRGYIFTDSFRSISTNLNKEIFLATVESEIFPHPQGFFSHGMSDKLSGRILEFPLISKPVTGRHGEGIEIHQDQESLKRAVVMKDENFLIQKFIEIEAEYRILVVGDRALGAVSKKPAEGKNIANYAAGASFNQADLSEELLAEAVRLCIVQEIDIGGVDIVKSKDQKYYLLEINRCPEFKAFSTATQIDVAEHIIEFIKKKSSKTTH